MRRFVQNLLVGSGVTKVTLVLKIARRIQQLFTGWSRKDGWPPKILVMGPWTGPRSRPDFIAAADLLDKALAVEVPKESGMHYMSVLYSRRRYGKVTESEWRTQSKRDLVCSHCSLGCGDLDKYVLVQLHPTQHGCNKILERMKYHKSVFYKLVRNQL
jgi:hypothetical protein